MSEERPPSPGETATDSISLATEAYPRFDQAAQQSVRLVISIPVLILLIVLGSGTVVYIYLKNMAETAVLTAPARDKLEGAALAILLLSLLISLLASLVGYVLARQIVKPIKELSGTMEAIAAGDLSTKLQPITLGEFGPLGTTFNRMVEQLNHLFEERDRQLRQSFTGAHMLLDQTGKVLQADQAVRRVFKIAPQDLMGRNLLDGSLKLEVVEHNPRLLDSVANLHREAIHGRAASANVAIRGADGRFAERYLVSCLPMETQEGETIRVLMEVRDISGISSFYEQIQRADRLAAIGTLATGIAHEIRNPLASIRGMVQLMAELAPPPQQSDDPNDSQAGADYHRRIIKEVDRLEKLIAGIMKFAHAEDSPAEEVDVNMLLHEVVDTARHHVQGADAIDVRWELDEALPRAKLQPERLSQALINLVTNAFQHCVNHQLSPVRIQSMHLPVNSQRPIIVCIANPGDTIPEADRERLFEPFYTTKADGTGLGLPIAYQTIKSNGGILELECEEGEIQFIVRLPKDVASQKTASGIMPKLSGTDSSSGMWDRRESHQS